MHVEDRNEILENLKSGSEALAEALTGISEENARRSPNAGRWSILECVEHVAAAEEYLLNEICHARRSEAPMINIAREAAIVDRGMNRARRIEAPEVARPRNRFATLKEAHEHFETTRKKTVRFVEDCLDDPRSMIANHPIVGTANNYEILLMMAIHPHRHAEQIREIRGVILPGT
jgi:hypothetical protein